MQPAGFAAVLVECTNCDFGTPWWQIAIAAGSVLLSAGALVVALRALNFTTKQHKMMSAEHKHFLADVARKPDLKIDVHFKPEGTTIELTGDVWAEIVVGVHNAGDRTIDSAVVNILLPGELDQGRDYLKRIDSNDHEIFDKPQPADERLPTSDGGEVAMCFFDWDGQQYVAATHYVHRFRFPLNLADTPMLIPVKVQITSEQGAVWEKTAELKAARAA